MKPGKKSKADLGFRLNRSFGTGARNSEAVTQRRKPVFPFVSQQRSDSGLRDLRSACSIAAAGNVGSTSGFEATVSSKWAPASDQKQVLPGGNFRALERFSPSRCHKAVAQSAASHPYC
jgi:hypothetical protein